MPLPLSAADRPGGAAPSTPTLALDVANDLAALRQAGEAVRQFAEREQLGDRLAFKLDLVLEEMLMNRIEHAFAPGQPGITRVALALHPDAAVLTFEDDGVPFDPLQVPDAAPAASLKEAKVGGLGLALTRKAARECRYEWRGGRNCFTVVLDRA